jgi:hypothetical protein
MGEAVKKTSQLLVGSIPLRSAFDVFTTASDYFGDNLASMPDGEFGDRIWWHNYLVRYVYHGHLDIKPIKRPAPIDGIPNRRPRDLSDMWLFEVQDGVTSIKLPELGYAKWAAAYVCGFGRRSLEDTKRLLSRHRDVAAALAVEG